MKNVYIIILNYKGYQDTIECLESVFESNYDNFHVVVCDNYSPNESECMIINWQQKNLSKSFKYIQTGSNLGFAGGNNIGIKYAMSKNADYIWLLNNDTVVKSNTLLELVNKAESDKDIGICGSKLMYYLDRNSVQGLAGKYNPITGRAGHIFYENDLKDMKYVIGASMLIKRSVIEDVGLLSERYFLYFEELDLSERIKGKYKLSVALKSIVYHKEGASIGKEDECSTYYLLRNGLIFSSIYYKKYLPIVYIVTFFRIVCPWKKRMYNRIDMLKKVLFNNDNR